MVEVHLHKQKLRREKRRQIVEDARLRQAEESSSLATDPYPWGAELATNETEEYPLATETGETALESLPGATDENVDVSKETRENPDSPCAAIEAVAMENLPPLQALPRNTEQHSEPFKMKTNIERRFPEATTVAYPMATRPRKQDLHQIPEETADVSPLATDTNPRATNVRERRQEPDDLQVGTISIQHSPSPRNSNRMISKPCIIRTWRTKKKCKTY